MKVRVKRKILKEQASSKPTWMDMMGGDAGISDPDMSTLPMPAKTPASTETETASSSQETIKSKIKELGYKLEKKLGEGQYGTVYLVTKNNTEYALKVVGENPNDQDAQQREVENYKKVQMARVKNPLIAKHFPKTILAQVIDGYGYIVMEKLEFGSGSFIIDDMFQGAEATIPADREQQHKSMAKKAYQVLTNEKSRNALLDSMFTLFVLPEEVEQEIQGEMEVVTYLNRGDLGSEKPESEEQLIKMAADIIPPAAYEYIFNIKSGDTPQAGDLRAVYYFNPGLLVFLLKALNTVKKIQPQQYMRTEYSAVVEFANFLRQASPVPLHYKHKYGKGSGASEPVAGAFKEATSIRQALDALEKEAGLVGRDMHDQNAMIRPRTGDIVIVDLGLFRPSGGSLEERKKKRKKRRKRRSPSRRVGYYGGGYAYHDYSDSGGDFGGDGGGGGDGKRDDAKTIKVRIVKSLKEKKKKDPVSKEISKLRDKGVKQDQAVAIALSMDERGELDEKFSKSERAKRAKKCDNPKGFTMKQFCKNQKTRSKKGERKNEEMELEERCQKGYKTHPKRKTKKMFGKQYRNCVKAEEGKDPAKGTGKKPKGSGRRLYTDEDPSDTVSVSFKSVSAIQKTLSKKSFKSKSHKRQSQIINLIHQRARAAYQNAKDPKVKARLKKAYEYAEKRKEASKKKTIRMRKKKK